MKITLITAQSKVFPWANAACDTYIKRLSGNCEFKIIDLTADKRTKKLSGLAAKTYQTSRLLQSAAIGDYLIVCDEQGTHINSKQLAEKISQIKDLRQNISIIIGGSDGLDRQQISTAGFTWSLSKLTMPQHLARIVVLEQLYRAFSLMHNHPYHRDG